MKQVLVAGLCLGVVFTPVSALARVSAELPETSHFLNEGAVMPWDEPEVVAQQQPTPTPAPAPASSPTPTPVMPTPVTPPAVTPAATATPPAATQLPTPPADVAPPAADESDPATPNPEGTVEDDFSLGDIPVVETLELTPEKARSALDVYVLVRDKYKDAALEDFENLQDFVDSSAQGKAFEADVKAAGFANVTEWNTTITTMSFAYDNLLDDQTATIKQQITELQNDVEIAQDMRDRMIAALNSMIPSENNKKIVETLHADPAFKDKLKQLETEGE